MNLSGIISISGKSGLSKIVSQTRTGLIVESLTEGKRFPVHGAERVSSLEDISIYTYEDDILLAEVFEKMYAKANGKEILSHKSSADELSGYLREILPNYDEERVYTSDIKKLVQWYNLLHAKNMLIPDEKEEAKEKSATTKKEVKKPNETKKSTAKPKDGKVKAPNKAAAPPKKSAPKAAAKGR